MSDPVGSGNGDADLADEEVRYHGVDRLDGDLLVTDRRILVGEDAGTVVGTVAGGDHDRGTGSEGSGADNDADADADAESAAGHDADRDVVAIPLESVSELTVQSIDWFLLLMDVAIIGFGVLSLDRTLLGGVAFLVAGLGSLGLTWRRRGRVRIHTHSRPKPVDTYPVHRSAFLDAVDEVLAPIRAERPPEGESVGLP